MPTIAETLMLRRRWQPLAGANYGRKSQEREDARARTEYVAAARRFVDAVGVFISVGVPVAPKSAGQDLPTWDRHHEAATLELEAALRALITTRRAYDSGRRRS